MWLDISAINFSWTRWNSRFCNFISQSNQNLQVKLNMTHLYTHKLLMSVARIEVPQKCWIINCFTFLFKLPVSFIIKLRTISFSINPIIDNYSKNPHITRDHRFVITCMQMHQILTTYNYIWSNKITIPDIEEANLNLKFDDRKFTFKINQCILLSLQLQWYRILTVIIRKIKNRGSMQSIFSIIFR